MKIKKWTRFSFILVFTLILISGWLLTSSLGKDFKLKAEEASTEVSSSKEESEVEPSTSDSITNRPQTQPEDLPVSDEQIPENTNSQTKAQITAFAVPALVKDTSNINVYKESDKNTWTKGEFANSWDFTKSTYKVHVTNGVKADKTTGKFGDVVTFTNLPLNIGTTAGRKTFTTDFGMLIQNVRYGVQLVDVKVTVKTMTMGTLTQADANSFGKALAFRLAAVAPDGVSSIWTHSNSQPLLAQRIAVDFYKAGTSTRLAIKTPIGLGDFEGAFNPNNIAGSNYFETPLLFNGTDTTMFPRYNFFAPWGQPINGTNPATGKPITTTFYKYREGTTVWIPKNAIFDLLDWKPRTSQFSVDFQGTGFEMGRIISIGNYLGGRITSVHGTYLGFPFAVPSQAVAPKKYVSDDDEKFVDYNTLGDLHETFTYSFDASFPVQSYSEYNLKKWQLSDTLPPGLAFNGGVGAIKVKNVFTGVDLTNKFTIGISGQLVVVRANPETLSDITMYGQNSNLRITVPVRVTDASKITYDENGKVKIVNKAILSGTYFTGENFSINSNEVVTTAKNINDLVVSKTVDKHYVEVGDKINDPIGLDETSNPITYRIRVTNSGTGKNMDNIVIRDALPYNGDPRKSSLTLPLQVANVSVEDSTTHQAITNAEIWYKNASPSSSDTELTYNPSNWANANMSSNGYTLYQGDTTALSELKLIIVRIPNLPPGKTYELVVQTKVKDVGFYANNASVGSIINIGQQTQVVHTLSMKRNLSGTIWFDDNLNGLMDVEEERIKNTTVGLYRTSTINSTFVDQNVTKNLLGTSFISGANPIIATNATGDYQFDALPEGLYSPMINIGYGISQGRIIPTTKLVGGDANAKINSKAEPATRRVVEAPNTNLFADTWVNKSLSIEELAKLKGYDSYIPDVSVDNIVPLPSFEGIHTMKYNHFGVVRSSRVHLFKYKDRTLTDSDGDGTYSQAELDAAMKLEGAVFEIYKGTLTDYPSDGATNPAYIGAGTTDATGMAHVESHLFPKQKEDGTFVAQDITIFEVKAPTGYELLKKPIHHSITKANEDISFYVSDDVKTELPETGGQNRTSLLLILSSSILLMGLISLAGVYYITKRKQQRGRAN